MVTAKMRKEKSVYYTTQLVTDKSSKDMWRTLNKILPKKNTTETIKSTNLTAGGFNNYFSSTVRTLCNSFKNNCLPSTLCPMVDSLSNCKKLMFLLFVRNYRSSRQRNPQG